MRAQIVFVGLLFAILGLAAARPQDAEEKSEPMPYNYNWEVNDEESKSYYGHEEKGTEAGRTEGKYFVWLADGRLMTVEYYVDGESGFVPKITFSDPNFAPPAAAAAAA
ncbi:unnamed protein product [Orchesella dallaii]|uniref:Pro-resilin n=1 Tax=Orchesella dallaii TaxID=48710 RepID=A0ABP1PPN8_9HEXA